MSIYFQNGTPVPTTPVITNVVYSANSNSLTSTFSVISTGGTHVIALANAVAPLANDPAWVAGADTAITFNDVGDGDYTAYLYAKNALDVISSGETRVVSYTSTPAVTNARITSVTAVGNEITFHHSHESTSPLADYDGYSITVNGNASAITYSSGDPDWQIKFTNDAGAFSGGDVIVGFYVAAGNDMQEVGGGHLIDSDTSLSPFTVAGTSNPNDPPVIGVLNLPNAIEGQSYSYFIPVISGVVETYNLVTGSLPSWLNLNLSTGEFSGTPAVNDPDVTGISVSATHSVNGTSATSNVDTLNIVAPGAGWTMSRNFEAGVVGAKAQGDAIGFTDTANESYYVGSPSHTGNRAIKTTVESGETGWPKWGGAFKFSDEGYPNVKKGETIWYRSYFLFPQGFNFSTSSGEGMKFMRIHVARADGSNNGYHHNTIHKKDLFIGGEVTDVDGNTVFNTYPVWTDPTLRGAAGQDGNGYPGVATFLLDTWHCVEMMVYFHDVPGQGIRRTWFDGSLVFEDLQTGTLKDAGGYSNLIYNFTYFNGGAPKTQSNYIDDVIITTDNAVANKEDAAGNKMIGPTDWPNP